MRRCQLPVQTNQNDKFFYPSVAWSESIPDCKNLHGYINENYNLTYMLILNIGKIKLLSYSEITGFELGCMDICTGL